MFYCFTNILKKYLILYPFFSSHLKNGVNILQHSTFNSILVVMLLCDSYTTYQNPILTQNQASEPNLESDSLVNLNMLSCNGQFKYAQLL